MKYDVIMSTETIVRNDDHRGSNVLDLSSKRIKKLKVIGFLAFAVMTIATIVEYCSQEVSLVLFAILALFMLKVIAILLAVLRLNFKFERDLEEEESMR